MVCNGKDDNTMSTSWYVIFYATSVFLRFLYSPSLHPELVRYRSADRHEC